MLLCSIIWECPLLGRCVGDSCNEQRELGTLAGRSRWVVLLQGFNPCCGSEEHRSQATGADDILADRAENRAAASAQQKTYRSRLDGMKREASAGWLESLTGTQTDSKMRVIAKRRLSLVFWASCLTRGTDKKTSKDQRGLTRKPLKNVHGRPRARGAVLTAFAASRVRSC